MSDTLCGANLVSLAVRKSRLTGAALPNATLFTAVFAVLGQYRSHAAQLSAYRAGAAC